MSAIDNCLLAKNWSPSPAADYTTHIISLLNMANHTNQQIRSAEPTTTNESMSSVITISFLHFDLRLLKHMKMLSHIMEWISKYNLIYPWALFTQSTSCSHAESNCQDPMYFVCLDFTRSVFLVCQPFLVTALTVHYLPSCTPMAVVQ